MERINTGILPILASIAWLAATSALAADADLVPIVPATVQIALPGVETKSHALTAIHLWATWCVPCLKELPEVDAVAARYKDKGLHVAAISLDTNMAKMQQFFVDKGIKTLTPTIDTNNAAFLASKLKGLPGTLFFDRNGELIARADGPVDWKAKATTDFIEGHVK